MNYHLKSRERIDYGKRFFIFLVAPAMLILLVAPGFFFGIGAYVAHSSKSVLGTISDGAMMTLSYFTSRNTLVKENNSLLSIAHEIDSYKSKNTILEEENQLLKKIRATNTEGIIAQVISNPPRTIFDTLIIESDLSLNVNDRIFTESDAYIGVIKEVGMGYAKVVLHTLGNNITTVENQRTGHVFELTGKGGGNFIASLPKEIDIRKDDILIVRMENKPFVVARVHELEVRDSSPFVFMTAVSPVSIFALHHVIVLPALAHETKEQSQSDIKEE